MWFRSILCCSQEVLMSQFYVRLNRLHFWAMRTHRLTMYTQTNQKNQKTNQQTIQFTRKNRIYNNDILRLCHRSPPKVMVPLLPVYIIYSTSHEASQGGKREHLCRRNLSWWSLSHTDGMGKSIVNDSLYGVRPTCQGHEDHSSYFLWHPSIRIRSRGHPFLGRGTNNMAWKGTGTWCTTTNKQTHTRWIAHYHHDDTNGCGWWYDVVWVESCQPDIDWFVVDCNDCLDGVCTESACYFLIVADGTNRNVKRME